MYYAAMRPEEVTDLRDTNIAARPESAEEWGEFLLTNSQPRSGSNWTDGGSVRQRQELKHRAKDETRRVPMHLELAALLRAHRRVRHRSRRALLHPEHRQDRH
jgi:hypothetical protein